eukprot:PhM_4_TR4066/c0_g1_i1/m.39057
MLRHSLVRLSRKRVTAKDRLLALSTNASAYMSGLNSYIDDLCEETAQSITATRKGLKAERGKKGIFSSSSKSTLKRPAAAASLEPYADTLRSVDSDGIAIASRSVSEYKLSVYRDIISETTAKSLEK